MALAVHIMMRNARKLPICNLRTTQALISLRNAQADLGLRCPLSESMDTILYVDEQRMSTDAQARQGLCYSQFAPEPFSCVANQL